MRVARKTINEGSKVKLLMRAAMKLLKVRIVDAFTKATLECFVT